MLYLARFAHSFGKVRFGTGISDANESSLFVAVLSLQSAFCIIQSQIPRFHDAGNVIAGRSINSPELIFDLEFIIEATKIEMNKMKETQGRFPS